MGNSLDVRGGALLRQCDVRARVAHDVVDGACRLRALLGSFEPIGCYAGIALRFLQFPRCTLAMHATVVAIAECADDERNADTRLP
jgi:hypothetical protein